MNEKTKTLKQRPASMIFLNEIFALVIFKTKVVPFSLQVFILHNCKHPQIRDAIYKLNEFDLAVFRIKFALAPEWLRKDLSMYEIKTLYHRKC